MWVSCRGHSDRFRINLTPAFSNPSIPINVESRQMQSSSCALESPHARSRQLNPSAVRAGNKNLRG
jgi:hypothetical protein